MKGILHVIDRLAGAWLEWHQRHDMKTSKDDGYEEWRMESLRLENREGRDHVEVLMSHPYVVYMADELSSLLDDAHAENFVQFDVMPRIDRNKGPIRVTIQWMKGVSPSEKCSILTKENEVLKFELSVIANTLDKLVEVVDGSLEGVHGLHHKSCLCSGGNGRADDSFCDCGAVEAMHKARDIIAKAKGDE